MTLYTDRLGLGEVFLNKTHGQVLLIMSPSQQLELLLGRLRRFRQTVFASSAILPAGSPSEPEIGHGLGSTTIALAGAAVGIGKIFSSLIRFGGRAPPQQLFFGHLHFAPSASDLPSFFGLSGSDFICSFCWLRVHAFALLCFYLNSSAWPTPRCSAPPISPYTFFSGSFPWQLLSLTAIWWDSKPGLIQIRAQLADCGAPIVGDSMYMPAVIAELASPGVNPFGKYKKQFESDADREFASEEWAAKHGKEPSVAIGLQACQISWDEAIRSGDDDEEAAYGGQKMRHIWRPQPKAPIEKNPAKTRHGMVAAMVERCGGGRCGSGKPKSV
ncbi:pseudouridine synthase family protein [Artemisia annua]|uniref:Pseudouridine synthase family protein n=1 Tax=Artemisia annua TaxID=35608 RepID=A0A2U1PPN6_ARTAN|nr:pseudouridine synthase family protein [Artemisia annua]